MLKLIRLEWKKNDISKYIRNALILTVILLLFLFLIAGELETDETKLAYGGSMLKTGVELLTNMSYMVLQA